jgi:hypothetical protein
VPAARRSARQRQLAALRDVQQRVADALGTMCGVNVRAVDVDVEAVA